MPVPYVDLATVKQMFGTSQVNELCSGSATVAADSVAQAAVDRANAHARGYVSVRYKNELVEVPSELKQHTGEIALRFMCKGKVPDFIQKNFDIADGWLKGVARGIPILSPDNADTVDESAVKVSSSDRVFTQDNFRVF